MRARSTTLLVLFLACSLITLAVLLSLSGASPVAAQGGVRHVAPGADCGAATPCYASVQAALDAASPGDLIKVAGGTYAGVTSRQGYSQSVYISQTITIRGGYSTADWSVSDPVANVTTLDAENLGYVVRTAGWSGRAQHLHHRHAGGARPGARRGVGRDERLLQPAVRQGLPGPRHDRRGHLRGARRARQSAPAGY